MKAVHNLNVVEEEMNSLESADVGLLREKLVVQTLFQGRPLGGAVVLQKQQQQTLYKQQIIMHLFW